MGNNVTKLTNDNNFESRPSWSPNGMKIAFSSFRFLVGNSEIYVVDADGKNEINLTQHEMGDVVPSWSPDGSKIAFAAGPQNVQFHPLHIFVINADGKERRNLTDDTNLTDSFSPTWSPDGKSIVFSSRPNISGASYLRDGPPREEARKANKGKGLQREANLFARWDKNRV